MTRGPRSSSPRGAPAWLAPAAAAVVPCLPFLPLLLRGETLWFRDFHLYFVPMKALLVELWRSGELPLWDPAIRNGLPFLANPQTGVFYPPSLLLVAFGLDPGLTLFLLLHLAVAGGGFYAFLRAARIPPGPSLFGALAFSMSGYLASLPNVLNNLQSVVWVPWLLAFSLRLRSRRALREWLGLVFAISLAFLGGELQLAALGLAISLALALGLGSSRSGRPDESLGTFESGPGAPALNGSGIELGRWRGRFAVAGLILCAATAAAALTAAQLLPTAELVGESVRRGGLPFELASAGSLHPSSLFSLAFPRPAIPGTAASGPAVTGEMPWLLSGYLGAGVVLLAVIGLSGPRRRWTVFWTLAAVLGVLLALGSHSPLFRAAFAVVPGFASVRYPEKFLLLTSLAVPALAAAGAERALCLGASTRALAGGLASGVLVVALSALGSWLWMTDSLRSGPASAVAWAGAILAGTAAVLLAHRRRNVEGIRSVALLCAVTALDLGAAARAVNPSVPWRFYEERPWAARVIARDPQPAADYRLRSTPLSADMEQVAVVGRARFFSNHYFFQQSLAPNLGQLYGVLQQDGMAGIETRGTADQIDELVAQDPRRALRLLRLQAVRYLVTSFPLPAEEVTQIAAHPELPIGIVRMRDPLPRAYVATRWRVEPQPLKALREALDERFVSGMDVVLDRPPWPATGAGAAAPRERSNADRASEPPSASVHASWKSASARFDLDLERPGVLVVTDSYFPGWRATLDGRAVSILRADGYQRGVAVPPGRHRVELRYHPAGFAWGSAVSGLAALALALAAWRGHRSRTRPRARGNGGPGGTFVRSDLETSLEPACLSAPGVAGRSVSR